MLASWESASLWGRRGARLAEPTGSPPDCSIPEGESMRIVILGTVMSLGLIGFVSAAQADEEKIAPKDLPKAVLKAAKKLFPDAKIRGASKEEEDGETLYEVEMTVDGKAVDVLFEPDGEVEAIEKEIEAEDLPKAVRSVIKKKYARARIEKVEEITEEDDKVLYEIIFKEKGEDAFEVVIAPNGKILADEDDEKGEEKEKAGKKDKDDEKKPGKKKEKEDEDDDEKGEKKSRR